MYKQRVIRLKRSGPKFLYFAALSCGSYAFRTFLVSQTYRMFVLKYEAATKSCAPLNMSHPRVHLYL